MSQQTRPPIITIMGHVDHGKTTLLDYIRKSRITAGEAGGITQHIGAYSIMYKDRPITFIDTPGHAAFNKMRERGAQITDIVILVVAANDGVKPQTVESIRHITTAGVPVIVAINKSDLPDINFDLAKAGLAEHGLVVTEYGGDIEAVPISAKTGKGVDKLLETILVMADLLELQADPQASLEAIVIEASKDSKSGVVATAIVKNGTLSVRQDIYTDLTDGRVKRLANSFGESLTSVLPGFAAAITGFNDLPSVGSAIRAKGAEYPAESESAPEAPEAEPENDWGDIDFSQLVEAEEKVHINLIIKADVEGTLEAILQNIDEDSTKLISSGVGEVTERDVELAKASGALIISFHTPVSKKVKRIAKDNLVKIKSYTVIYQLIEDLQKQMLKFLEPTIDEVVVGEAEILQIFEMRGDRIAGCKVRTGEIKKIDRLHLKRGDAIIANPVIKTLMQAKIETTSVKAKNECGITFRNRKLDFQVGDILVAYTIADDD